MRQRDAAAFLFLSTLACCVVCLATQSVNGEEPIGDSPAEAMARQEIIDSPRWAEAQQQLNDWLSIQSVYTEAQVEALKSELWPVRKKMSHSLFEKLSDAASKKDASHQFGSLRH